MKSPEGIQGFIEYKQNVEKERPILFSEKRLITIDGVDGSGKSTIAKKLADKLKKNYGDEHVVLADITNLKGSPKQESLGMLSKRNDISGARLDMVYAAGVNRAYGEIVSPSLKEGKIVIIDRSEIDLLRYAIENHDTESVKKRKKYIQDGSLTHRFWAGNRIFIEADENDVWLNLSNREKNSRFDPTSKEGVSESIYAQHEAEKQIESFPHQGEVNIIRERIVRIADVKQRDEYLDSIALNILSKINL